MQFEVQILGSNSAVAENGRHPTSQVVYLHDKLYLVDCGEGTQLRMQSLKVKRFRIEHIFISHLHGDHYFGLIGLISTYHLLRRAAPLTIYGPAELEEIIRLQLAYGSTNLCYPLHFVHIGYEAKQVLLDNDDVRISSVPVKHRINTAGFIFEEKTIARKLRKSVVESMGLSADNFKALRQGKDIVAPNGKKYTAEELTMPGRPPRKYAFITDTLYNPDIVEHIQNADLLYHEATFMHEHVKRAAETFHCTAVEAGRIAKMAEVKKMLLGHFSSKYIDLEPLLSEARTEFPESHLAEEGKIFGV